MNTKFTYRDLRNLLNERQHDDPALDRPVRVLYEDSGITASGVWVVEEDQVNPSGDGMEPISAYSDDPDADLEIVAPKGSIFLMQ